MMPIVDKAFNTVNNFILTEKLQKIDILPTVINWIIHFLND